MGSDKVHVNIVLVGSEYVPLMEKKEVLGFVSYLIFGKEAKENF